MPLVVVSGEFSSDGSQLAGHADLAARSRRGRHAVAKGAATGFRSIVPTSSSRRSKKLWLHYDALARRARHHADACSRPATARWVLQRDAAGAVRPADHRRVGGRRRRHASGHSRSSASAMAASHAIGDLAPPRPVRRIDATGLTVAPGFIDIHNHSDYTILLDPKAESMIRQGVTTMVLGESRSAGPVKPRRPRARRRRDGGLDDAWRLLQQARTPADGDQHRVVRRRRAGVDLRQGLRPEPGDGRRTGGDEGAGGRRRWRRARWGSRRRC